MPANYVLLEKITVGAAGASSVTFSGIPQTGYTDLVLVSSARNDSSNVAGEQRIEFNGSSSNLSVRALYGTGNAGSGSYSSTVIPAYNNGGTSLANTFGSETYYIPNYTSSNFKSVSSESVFEDNAAQASQYLVAGLWSSTSAITSITLTTSNNSSGVAANFVQGSTFYLYGVAKLGTTPAISPYATGGDTIMTDGTYWYHAFLSSGTFTPAKGLSADVLVAAGGGGGGGDLGGGGGAGGVIAFAAQTLASGTGYTATIGAGGAGSANASAIGSNGSNSSFTGLTAAVGGGGGGCQSTGGSNGGSGGGAPRNSSSKGTATSGQGFDGGIGTSGLDCAGSGGGAGAAGGARSSGGPAPVGGAGTNSVTNWGALSAVLTTTGLGVSGYIAGGGGVGGYQYAPTGSYVGSAGGSGGGGANTGGAIGGSPGVNGNPGVANTGSGGAAGSAFSGLGGAGGSGLVIVRYAV